MSQPSMLMTTKIRFTDNQHLDAVEGQNVSLSYIPAGLWITFLGSRMKVFYPWHRIQDMQQTYSKPFQRKD